MTDKPDSGRAPFLPPRDFADRPVPVTDLPLRKWHRIHKADASALDFQLRSFHRFSHPDYPHPILYLASNLRTSLWEVFGDDLFQQERTIAQCRWDSYNVSTIQLPALRVCAVNQERTRAAMSVDKSSLLASQLDIPKAWSLAIQNHPANFAAIHYTSRFVDHLCLALFDRDDLRHNLEATALGSLNDHDEAVNWLDTQQAVLV